MVECVPYSSLFDCRILPIIIFWIIKVLPVGLGNGVIVLTGLRAGMVMVVMVVVVLSVSSGAGHDQASFWDFVCDAAVLGGFEMTKNLLFYI